jgi:hypothetical protein
MKIILYILATFLFNPFTLAIFPILSFFIDSISPKYFNKLILRTLATPEILSKADSSI